MKNQYKEDCLKKGISTVCKFKGGLVRKSGTDTPFALWQPWLSLLRGWGSLWDFLVSLHMCGSPFALWWLTGMVFWGLCVEIAGVFCQQRDGREEWCVCICSKDGVVWLSDYGLSYIYIYIYIYLLPSKSKLALFHFCVILMGAGTRFSIMGALGDTLHQSKIDQITLIKSQSVPSSKSPYQSLFPPNKSLAYHRQFC